MKLPGSKRNRVQSSASASAAETWSFPMAMEGPGAAGALVKMAGKDPGVGGTLVYFSFADCVVEVGRAVEYGGKVYREKFSIGECGHIALVHDTVGNMIGLHSMQTFPLHGQRFPKQNDETACRISNF